MVVEESFIDISCPSCRNTILITDSDKGEILCTRCGCVIKERAESFEAEHIIHEMEEYDKKTRAQRSVSLEGKYVVSNTKIGGQNTDYTGRVLNTGRQDTMERLRRLETRILSRDIKRKGISSIHYELEKIKDKLSLSDHVVEEALRLYIKGVELYITIGRYRLALLAASVYIACKNAGAVRSLKEITSAMNLKQRQVFRYYMLLTEKLQIQTPLTDPSRWVIRIANRMGLDEVTKRKALELLGLVKRKNYNRSRNPASVAAAVVYLACCLEDKHILQPDVAEAADVTEVTIRATCSDLKILLGLQNII